MKKQVRAVPVSRIPTILHRNPPSGQLAQGLFKIKYTEYVCPMNVIGREGWMLVPPSDSAQGLDVNAGSALMFPWLSEQARHWEMYKFNSLTFELIPKQPTSSRGLVAMAFDYDYDDSVAYSKAEMLQNLSMTEGATYNPLRVVVDCSRLNKVVPYRYVSNANGTVNGEPRMSYAGFLMVALDSVTVGESYGFDLWVSYEVVLNIPRPATELVDTGRGTAVVKSAAEIVANAYRFPSGMNTLPMDVRSVFRISVPGEGGVPVLVDSNSKPIDEVIDLEAMNGVLLKNTHLSPTTNGFTSGYYVGDWISCWNSVGTLLFSVWAHSGAGLAEQGGSWSSFYNYAGSGGGAGIASVLTSAIPIDGLRKLYPGLRYLGINPKGFDNGFLGTAAGAAVSAALILLSGDKHQKRV